MKKELHHLSWTLTALLGLLWTSSAAGQFLAPPDKPWLLRTTAIGVLTDTQSDGPLNLDTDETVDFAFDATYFVTPNIAVNVLATFINLEVKTNSSALASGFGTDSLGSVDILPPIVTFQWHFIPEGKVRPYVGAGFNYNVFYNESGTLEAVGAHIDNTFGFVAQAGLDYMLSDHFSLNADFKYLGFEADVDVGAAPALNDDLEVDAFIFGVGLGYRF
ncbi:MAG: outer membrane beta-barrel protein [Betaproteobacteria bacterium]|nr:outer membrane beta-barrel protein [Betaproteobacteria bacterium]